MATTAKIDREITDKRPLRLECVGGPYTYMRVDEHNPLQIVPITEDHGGHDLEGALPIVAQYVLDGNVYRYEVLR